MHAKGRCKCRHCKEFFIADPRNRYHQRSCAKPACRRASKAASQKKWERKPQNRDCYRGPERIAKVRAWRAAHPGYWKRRRKGPGALPEVLIAQVVEPSVEANQDAGVALPELWRAQPPLLLGLIAQLTGVALPEDIAVVAHRLVARGQALLGHQPEKHEDRKTHPLAAAAAPLSAAVLVR